jgi:predicted permease
MPRTVLSRILGVFRRHRLEKEFDEEVRTHLELLTERFIRRGLEPEEAAYAARRQFGGITQVKQHHRDQRAFPVGVLLQDIRHAFRQLRKAKGFTTAAALTMALGIGATTAVFAVLDTVVLRPLPYAQPERLMAFRSIDHRGAPHPVPLSYPNFFDFRKQDRVFEHLVSYRNSRFTLTDSLPAIQVPGMIVSWDLFPLLGVQPELGRGFLPEEEKPGIHVVVLGNSLWKSRFGGDPKILGRQIRINGALYTVVGVTRAGFQFPMDQPAVQLWTTLSKDASDAEFTPLTEQRGAWVVDVMARLKPGIGMEQAQAQMDLVASALARQYPDQNKNLATTSVRPELERLTGSSRRPLWILLGAVMLVLLIACANTANLLLVRGTERAREFAVRMALGASPLAIIRQLLVESLALGMLGSAGGVLLAIGALQAVLPLAGDSIPRISEVTIDGRVLLFSIAVAILTSVLFTLAPAIQAAGADPVGGLKESARNVARGHHRLRSILVAGQIALGLVLLVGAELLMASFLRLSQRDPGFRSERLLTFQIGVSGSRYDKAGLVTFCDRLLDRLKTTPGVEAAVMGMPLPLEGSQLSVGFDIEKRPAPPPDRPVSNMAIVTPGYFGAMAIPLIRGRDFVERDNTSGPRVVIVNEAFARKYFPGEEVIGKRIEPGATNGDESTQMREIVGVVGNAKQVPLGMDPDPIFYFPYKQLSWGLGTIVLRTAVPPLAMESTVQAALVSVDRQAAIYQVRTGEDRAAAAISGPRFHMVLMGSFGAVALLLTVFGLYGVLSYTVERRRREIGVRMALGAERRDVLGLVLREAAQLVGAGLVVGLAGAFACSRVLETMLYGVRPGDPLAVAGACAAMVVTSMAASHLPAARAASVDPIEALRSE